MATQRASGGSERKPLKASNLEKKRSRQTGTDADVILFPKKSKVSKSSGESPSSPEKTKRGSLTHTAKLDVVRAWLNDASAKERRGLQKWLAKRSTDEQDARPRQEGLGALPERKRETRNLGWTNQNQKNLDT